MYLCNQHKNCKIARDESTAYTGVDRLQGHAQYTSVYSFMSVMPGGILVLHTTYCTCM